MSMMIEILNKKINEMKDLRQREERRDNKVAQNALDLQFKILTERIHQQLIALQYTKENAQFQLSDELIVKLRDLLEEHRGSIKDGLVEKDSINKVDTDFKSVQQDIKKEWSKHYLVLTKPTISTLRVISGIDSAQVGKCLEGIAKGEVWTTNIGEYKAMIKSLADAKILINGMGLDQEIISFLQKMNSGKATVMDLNEDVLNWLRKEALDKRVKLSFIGTAKRY